MEFVLKILCIFLFKFNNSSDDKIFVCICSDIINVPFLQSFLQLFNIFNGSIEFVNVVLRIIISNKL
jgi:hypothetical protein